jgi:hypothetical protein
VFQEQQHIADLASFPQLDQSLLHPQAFGVADGPELDG